jgi:predicted MPP superfamily phosphohydrolase
VRWLRAAAVLFVLLLPTAAWQSTSIALTRVDVPIAGLPPEFDGFRVLHVTDIHGRRLDPQGWLVAAIRAARPDVIAATGDFVDSSVKELAAITPFLRELAGIAPTYAVSGNHDYLAGWPAVASALRECGITVLENRSAQIRRGGCAIVLAGISDPMTRRHDLAAAIPSGGESPVILLSHAPFLHQRLREDGERDPSVAAALAPLKSVALTLAGHTHGGQIKLPLIGALSNASGRPFPRSYVEGLSWEGYGWLYISRGLGYTIMPLRFLARAEATILTLRVAP